MCDNGTAQTRKKRNLMPIAGSTHMARTGQSDIAPKAPKHFDSIYSVFKYGKYASKEPFPDSLGFPQASDRAIVARVIVANQC